MTSDIKPGDLVMVVRPRPCCGDMSAIGRVAKVVEMPSQQKAVCCLQCLCKFEDLISFRKLDDGNVCHASRLIKIDPPALADEVERVRELEAV